MDELLRKLVIVPLLLAAVAIAYLLMSLAVFLTRRSAWAVQKKIAVGCLLISLLGVPAATTSAYGTCYEPALTPQFTLPDEGSAPSPSSVLAVKKGTSGGIAGIVRYGGSLRFTFEVRSGSNIVASGDVVAVDGDMNGSSEAVTMAIDFNAIPAGTYELAVFENYPSGDTWVRAKQPIRRLRLDVSPE